MIGLAIVASLVMKNGVIHVSQHGPIRTLAEAQTQARRTKSSVVVEGGTYYLPEPLVFSKADEGIRFMAAQGEKVVLSGGQKLDLSWKPYKDGILQAKTPHGLTFDQLFVNDQRQIMARYPNYVPGVVPFGGYSADAFSLDRAKKWADPTGGFIHAMHPALWGGFQYLITGKDAHGAVTFEGGWQGNRAAEMHPKFRYVENIFEELDAPGEWFHNQKTDTLYYFPPKDVDLDHAKVEVVRLRNLVEFKGTKHVSMQGFTFRHSERTFMDTKEPLLRSDWTICRSGAIYFTNSEDCSIVDCELDQLGGNAVFVDKRNRGIRIQGCDIHDTGASAVAFVGDPAAVRNPLFEYNQHQNFSEIDPTPGPKTDNYPKDCYVEDCLIRHVGEVEKQASGVEISMSEGITIRHCSIYGASRSGINIGDGCWGGHVIEFCDVFDTVLETGDHGSFNAWGRDRYWNLVGAKADRLPSLSLLDAQKPITLRNNRWRCDHGWDVDLDDGSSNYRIYNNLFLNGGLKLREGFHRLVWNNITVNNSLHPHVWFENCADVVNRNIWMGAYRPAGTMPPGKWGHVVDRNLFTSSEDDRAKFASHGCDSHSVVGDPLFVDASQGDYRVRTDSPALKLGFRNFPMDQFGVQSKRLRVLARTPKLPNKVSVNSPLVSAISEWLGATVRELVGDEFSVYGVPKDSGGVLLIDVPPGCEASKHGLRRNDLIEAVDYKTVNGVADLNRLWTETSRRSTTISVVRDQRPIKFVIDR